MQDTEVVREQEQKLKRNSLLFKIAGVFTLVAGGALFAFTTGLLPGFAEGIFGAALGIGISAAFFGGFSILKNVFRKGSLKFPQLKLMRKSTESLASSAYRPFAETTWASKKLSKSDSNKVFFGVCSGLAQYAGVSPGLMRAAFVLGFFFSGGAIILPYIALSIILPAIKKREEA